MELSKIPNWWTGYQYLIDFMLDNRIEIIVNDFGSGIEYGIDDIEDSFDFFLKYKK